jgi:hypothetical protein
MLLPRHCRQLDPDRLIMLARVPIRTAARID